MERVRGVSLVNTWATLTLDAKVPCVKDVPGIVAQIFELRHDSIGKLYIANDVWILSESEDQNNAARSILVVVDRTCQ